jgi:hypothetical protein
MGAHISELDLMYYLIILIGIDTMSLHKVEIIILFLIIFSKTPASNYC